MRFHKINLLWPALLLPLSSFNYAHPQSENREGSDNQTYVTLPPRIIDRELTTLYHRKFRLADYSDKIIVVNLFASWCAPCRSNLWDLIDLKNKYKAQRIEVIGIVSDQNERGDIAFVRRFVREQKINFGVVWDTDEFGESLVKAVSGLSVLPQTFVIDTRGRIRKHFQGYNPTNTPQLLREALDQVGQETEPRKPAKSPSGD